LGGVWAPTNYMIIKGLQHYGYHELAALASERYLAGMYEVFKSTGTVWENYAPDSAAPGDIAKPDFVGWTGLGPISLLLENVLGIQLDALNNTIHWRLNRTDRHGVENLRFRGHRITLMAAPGESKADRVSITVTSNAAFTLDLSLADRRQSISIKEGTQVIEF
jgi:glycogen debranching enzyme